MALQNETQGQLQEFLELLNRRRWQVILPALFLVALGLAIAVIVPRKYKVSTRIEVKDLQIVNELPGRAAGSATVQEELLGAHNHIRHYNRVREIVERLKWPDYMELSDQDRYEYIQTVLQNIEVDVFVDTSKKGGGSSFIDIKYTDIEGDRAQQFLNRLAEAWKKAFLDRDIDLVRVERNNLQNHEREAEKRFNHVSADVSAIILRLGLDWQDVFGKRPSLQSDPIVQQLNLNNQERDAVEQDLAERRAEIALLELEYASEPATIQEDVATAALEFDTQVSALLTQISTLKAQQDRLTTINPTYQKLQDTIQELEEKISTLEALEREGTTQTRFIPNERKDLLRTAVGTKKVEVVGLEAKLDKLNTQITEGEALYQAKLADVEKLQGLMLDLQEASTEYLQLQGELNQVERLLAFISSPDADPFDVVEEARAPTRPEPPSPMVIVAFAGVAGVGLGLASAFLSEYSRNCYRSVHDLSRVMAIPVLGVVNTIVTTAEARQRRLRRAMVALSSAVLVGGLFWFTWAWTARRDLLPTEFIVMVEDFRQQWR